MKRRTIILATAVAIALLASSFFVTTDFLQSQERSSSTSSSGFYVGVQCGYSNVTLCKELIDKVKNYTDLFIVGGTDIIKNATLLNEVCDYAYNAGLHFSVYFSPLQSYTDLGDNVSQTATLPNGTTLQIGSYQSPLPMGWLSNATAKYGGYFLGAYVFDEPGGNQLDGGVQRLVNPNTETDYQNTAEAFEGNVTAKIQPYLNASIMTFTSDYGLYWFDYKAGYDAVLAEFGGNNNRQQQISLCRGAAAVQGKDWGIMITHRSSQEQVMEPGPQLYDDLVLGYESGAKYAVVFDYAQTTSYPKLDYQPYEYGILQDEHFNALKDFWNYMQQNPDKQGSLKANVALVLPRNYGFGLRTAQDNVWGLFNGDLWSQMIWSDVDSYLNQYGSRLDIVYDDPQFNNVLTSTYVTVIHWSSGSAGDACLVKDLNTTLGYNSIQEAIDAGPTCDGNVLVVKAGTYHENLVINKSLSIIGENKATTIIDGDKLGTVVNITKSNVELTGFTLENSGSNSGSGIYLGNVGNCSLIGNKVTANYYGVYLNSSSSNVLKNNEMNGNIFNFKVDGAETTDFVNDVDSSNTINGQSVCYIVNGNGVNIGLSYGTDIGYLALVNCTHMTAQGLSLHSNGNGIILVATDNSDLQGNIVANCEEGIQLIGSQNNTFRDNQLVNNTYGVNLQGLANDMDASNSVNGKTVYYWVNQHGKTVPSDAGYVALINCSGIIVQNLNLTENWQGIYLSSTTASTVSHNQVSNCHVGIALEASSTQNSIAENNVTDNTQGVSVSGCSQNTLSDNMFSNNLYGVQFQDSNNNTVSGNSVTQNSDHGLWLSACNNNTLTNNQMDNNGVGVEFINSSGDSVIQNSLSGNTQGIQIHGSSMFMTVADNNVTGSNFGVEIAIYPTAQILNLPPSDIYLTSNYGGSSQPFSSSHTVSGNTLTNNQFGIILNGVNETVIADNVVRGGNYCIAVGYQGSIGSYIAYNPLNSFNATVKRNTVTNAQTGIYLSGYSNCTIAENTAVNCSDCISLSSSSYNRIFDNNLSGKNGIQLSSQSSGNQLRKNTIAADQTGFGEDSVSFGYNGFTILNVDLGLNQPTYQVNDVDGSNTVNGKPIVYWVGQEDKTVPSNAACVILVNCTRITVENLNLASNFDGVQLDFTQNCTVIGNTIQNNTRGVRLMCSSYNEVEGNNITGNVDGINLYQEAVLELDPTTQTISQATAPSTGNNITGNNIAQNQNGITLDSQTYSAASNGVSGNTIYENNFLNNRNQVNPVGGSSGQQNGQNSWDNGKVGNYWSNYNGTDANHDGIGDTAYPIEAGTWQSTPSNGLSYVNVVVAEDHFPLMFPFTK